MTTATKATQSAPFNDIRHGDLERLDWILEGNYGPLDEQELRAAMQNLLEEIVSLKKQVSDLQYAKPAWQDPEDLCDDDD